VKRFFRLEDVGEDAAQSVARAAYLIARDIGAAAILTPTVRGNTPRLISKYRPRALVIAVTPLAEVQRKLLLYWGIVPLIGEIVEDSDALLTSALQLALDQGLVRQSDKVVTLAGVPIHSPNQLNLIRVHFIGTVLGKGKWGFGGYASGRIVKAIDALDAELKLKHDGTEVLLTRFLTTDFLPLLKGVRGVVLEESSYLGPEQIRAVEPGLVAIVSVPGAVSQIEEGLTVTLHGDEYVIYEGVVSRYRR
jgi:pyruvate kinase